MIDRAAKAIKEAEVFIITAGAGMGVDSGLPDFRGNLGFWNAYPAYDKLGLCFETLANPFYFNEDPQQAWGFYGHCAELYRKAIPHEGFHILRKWIDKKKAPYFVVTSNVDGQFQKAGFSEERVYEVHGSLHHLQCQTLCQKDIWMNTLTVQVDETSMRAVGELPICSGCGKPSRPNVLMFGDFYWLSSRTEAQKRAFGEFMVENASRRIVVIEMGAGAVIPTIRARTEKLGSELKNVSVVRINPREAVIAEPGISISCGALEGLSRIDDRLGQAILA